jgi:archaemetzincin
MITRLICFAIPVFALLACKDSGIENKIEKNSIVINLQPFGEMRAFQTQFVFTEIKKIYPFIEIRKSIALPKFAYNEARNRYRADSLIQFLKSRTQLSHKTIGLTNRDISTAKDNMADWGVMGLGYCPGNACIASTFRLSKSETNWQLFKVAIHELGHTFGLPHCAIKFCFMRDAEGKNPTNEEKGFCAKCKSFLSRKGWNLK